MSTKHSFTFLFISIISILFLIGLTYYFDNTTYITANGVYKAIIIDKLITQGQNFNLVLDLNHYLYLYFVTFIWKLLNLSAWPGTTLIKIAITNSVSAGLIIFCLISSLWLITRNLRLSLLTTTFYFFSAYFLFLATSSEDIMPAVGFFYLSVFSFITFIHHPQKLFTLAISGLSLGVALLLQRSLALAFPGFLFTLLIYFTWPRLKSLSQLKTSSYPQLIDKLLEKLKHPLIYTLAFILPIYALSPQPQIVLSPNLHLGGWFGFSWAKVFFTLFAGMGQSLFMGQNLTTFSYVLKPISMLIQIPTLFLLATIIYILIKRLFNSQTKLKPAIVFLLINFAIPEYINLSSQGQDPQLQLPPLIIIPLGLAIIYYTSSSKISRRLWQKLILCLCLLAIATNFYTIRLHQKEDSLQINSLKDFSQKVNTDHSFIITQGFDSLNSWGRWLLSLDDSHIVGLTSYLVNYSQLSSDQIATQLLQDIKAAQLQNKQVIITDIIKVSDEEFLSAMATVDPHSRSLVLKTAIIDHYRLELFATTTRGSLYLLTPKDSLN